jgi:hypothetical protein
VDAAHGRGGRWSPVAAGHGGGLGLLLGGEVEREDRAGGGGREGTELAVLCCAGLRSPEERV